MADTEPARRLRDFAGLANCKAQILTCGHCGRSEFTVAACGPQRFIALACACPSPVIIPKVYSHG